MKKYCAVTLVLAFATVAGAGLHIVGGTPNSNNGIPFRGGGSVPAYRWQTLWFQSELGEAGPITKIEWYTWGSPAGGTFNNCDILLCHTNVSKVGYDFAANYGTGTPVNVFSGTYNLPAHPPDTWVTLVKPANFDYNNSDNLLLEISWEGSPSGGNNFFHVRDSGSNLPGRVYVKNKTATTGEVHANYHHYGRVTVSAPAVDPTSLGRIKTLYN